MPYLLIGTSSYYDTSKVQKNRSLHYTCIVCN